MNIRHNEALPCPLKAVPYFILRGVPMMAESLHTNINGEHKQAGFIKIQKGANCPCIDFNFKQSKFVRVVSS